MDGIESEWIGKGPCHVLILQYRRICCAGSASLRVALQSRDDSPLRSCGWNATHCTVSWLAVGRRAGFELASFATPKGLAFASTAWQHVLCSTV